ncbi:MAG: hypothetical protein ACO3JL_03930 [Myxococcota bacterium]
MAALDTHDLERLLRVFHRRGSDGQRVYSDDDIRRFLPVLALAAMRDGELSEGVVVVLQGFAKSLGIGPETGAEDTELLVRRYLEQNPPHPQMLAEVRGILQEVLLQVGRLDASAAAKVLGQAVSSVPVGHGEVPRGSRKAGPLVRFELDSDPQKSED